MGETAKIWFDGACKPQNPGGTGLYGFVIETDVETHTENGVLGRDASITSNFAEYMALIRALEDASKRSPFDHLHILGDSELVINQLKGEWKINSQNLQLPYRKARSLIEDLEATVQLQHIPGEQNGKAHEQCEEAYESYIYQQQEDQAREHSMTVKAVGHREYEVDGETVDLKQQRCTCSTQADHGLKCIHISKVELIERGVH